jgi:hypothetical protein
VRGLSAFHRFLKVAALDNGRVLNYARVANDAGGAAVEFIPYEAFLRRLWSGGLEGVP